MVTQVAPGSRTTNTAVQRPIVQLLRASHMSTGMCKAVEPAADPTKIGKPSQPYQHKAKTVSPRVCLCAVRVAATSLIVAKFFRLTLVDTNCQPSVVTAALRFLHSSISNETRDDSTYVHPSFPKPSVVVYIAPSPLPSPPVSACTVTWCFFHRGGKSYPSRRRVHGAT